MIETVETNKSNDQDGKFDRNYTEVKRIKELIAEDGTKVPFTGNMKIVYAYLFTFQDNDKRHNYPAPIHPNMDLIAWENGITKPTAQKAVDALMQAGVLIKNQIQVGSGFKSNNYVVLKPSKVVAKGITPTHPNEAKSKKQKQQTEESKNDGKSKSNESQPAAVDVATLGNNEHSRIQLPVEHRVDAVPTYDEVNEKDDDPEFPPKEVAHQVNSGRSHSRRRPGSFAQTKVEDESCGDYSGEYGWGNTHQPNEAFHEPSQEEIDCAFAEVDGGIIE